VKPVSMALAIVATIAPFEPAIAVPVGLDDAQIEFEFWLDRDRANVPPVPETLSPPLPPAPPALSPPSPRPSRDGFEGFTPPDRGKPGRLEGGGTRVQEEDPSDIETTE
jgi:hypothetical protein